MLPKGICGILKRLFMTSNCFERYYGQTSDFTAFVRLPSHRPPTTVRYHHRCQAPSAFPDGLACPSGALGRRDCHHCVPQSRYRRARAQTFPQRRRGGSATAQSARHGAYRNAHLENRTPTGYRSRSAYRWRLQCQLDYWPVGDVSGYHHRHRGHRRDGALISPRRGLRLPASDVDPQAQSRGATGLRGKRLRVEVILAGAGTPTPPPVTALVDADLLEEVPPDVEELLCLLPHADVYLQDEIQFACHPTLTRVWCRKGRRGQRLVEAPGANDKLYGFGLVDWCDGWFERRLAPGRTAEVFCAQVRAAVARSRARGRTAIVIVDNLRTHTPAGSRLVRQMLAELHDHLRLIYTPAYDPDANRIEWLWRWSRREVTHNHQRTTFAALLEDIHGHFQTLAQHPDLILRQIGSPFAMQKVDTQELANAA